MKLTKVLLMLLGVGSLSSCHLFDDPEPPCKKTGGLCCEVQTGEGAYSGICVSNLTECAAVTSRFPKNGQFPIGKLTEASGVAGCK